jgi:hypothetical protein
VGTVDGAIALYTGVLLPIPTHAQLLGLRTRIEVPHLANASFRLASLLLLK